MSLDFVILFVLFVVCSCGKNGENSHATEQHIPMPKNVFDNKIDLPVQGDDDVALLSSVTNNIFDFGRVNDDTIISKTFLFTNGGNYPLLILDYSADCFCTNLFIDKNCILPNDTAKITLLLDTHGKQGKTRIVAKVSTNTALKYHKFVVRGEIISK